MNYLNERQRQILDMLVAHKEIKISFLKKKFTVTEMTLRRDLEKLEQNGHLRRIFGGAILIESDIALRERVGVMREEKERIGKQAADLVLPGESIFIDAGTTTVQVARHLKREYVNTVVTNGLNVASELQERGISTIVIGGNLLDTTFSLVGPIAVDTLSNMAYDRVFVGATGLTVEHGLSNSNMHETEVKRTAIQQAGEVNILLDHTKFDVNGLASFAKLNQVQRIITDQLPNPKLLEGCKRNKVAVMVAE
ncbi:DeoR/GlpR family DNA-binding transcription regulator [Virgibacillus sp. W0181]|uniref:DeoR/GlpR family DNA-binding transcription regulator n=1 Tax=Virgibacillus sp. W0181 TaxID=3391581 RepID=UPI003F4749C0